MRVRTPEPQMQGGGGSYGRGPDDDDGGRKPDRDGNDAVRFLIAIGIIAIGAGVMGPVSPRKPVARRTFPSGYHPRTVTSSMSAPALGPARVPSDLQGDNPYLFIDACMQAWPDADYPNAHRHGVAAYAVTALSPRLVRARDREVMF